MFDSIRIKKPTTLLLLIARAEWCFFFCFLFFILAFEAFDYITVCVSASVYLQIVATSLQNVNCELQRLPRHGIFVVFWPDRTNWCICWRVIVATECNFPWKRQSEKEKLQWRAIHCSTSRRRSIFNLNFNWFWVECNMRSHSFRRFFFLTSDQTALCAKNSFLCEVSVVVVWWDKRIEKNVF